MHHLRLQLTLAASHSVTCSGSLIVFRFAPAARCASGGNRKRKRIKKKEISPAEETTTCRFQKRLQAMEQQLKKGEVSKQRELEADWPENEEVLAHLCPHLGSSSSFLNAVEQKRGNYGRSVVSAAQRRQVCESVV